MSRVRDVFRRVRRPLAAAALAACALAAPATFSGAAATASGGDAQGWPVGGHDLANTRSNPFESAIGRSAVQRLAVKWSAATQGEISATPAVVDGAVYFPDWAGFFTKLDARTGRVIWSRRVSDYTGVAGDVSRTSPAVSHGFAYIGDQGGALGAGARLVAVDVTTGRAVWTKVVESHPTAVLTQSPIVFGGVVYEGVASQEEAAAGTAGYQCCTFRGSLDALDAATGRLRWKTYTVPDNGGAPGGYSGAAIWGGTPAIDPAHGRIYVTTGNNYEVPQSAKDCQDAGGSAADCLSPDDHINSILALDLATGAIKWAAGPRRFDDWNGGCIPGFPPDNCPNDPGPDFDFGDGPHLFAIHSGGRVREVVGAGQKSGEYWTVDAATGEVLWSAAAGPGGFNGGIQWGSATDGTRIYLAEADSTQAPYTLKDGRTVTSGSVAALDPATGRILWQVADPAGGSDTAAVTTANGVVYAGSLTGRMFALDATTGAVLWQFQGQGPSAAGPAVVDGTVYWGNGYPNRLIIPSVGSPSVFYAFAPGR
ncbi:MAG TPA: PQQ-binding-like beta-propeller repeat protein [Streptosporangiaceae bacterium]